MDILEQLKEWNRKLIPYGDYTKLKIEGVFNCKGLANLIREIRSKEDSGVLFFGEIYHIPEGKGLIRERVRKISPEGYIDLLKNYPTGIIIKRKLKPIPLRGNKEWGGHIVYCEKDIIFDPILGEPCEIKSFSQRLFGEEIPFEKIA